MNAVIFCRRCYKPRLFLWGCIGLLKGTRQYAYKCLTCEYRYVMYTGTNGLDW